ncbi:MAG: beta-galactosidase [Candidatus Omnitrophica bacterium]|nr:beta-galactosidase [Candidatus Omnitrophota bacterium]
MGNDRFLICKKGIYFISVVLWKWESFSDQKLIEELKRIEKTGFNTVRVFFDRKYIEKDNGKFDWTNPDRFFKCLSETNLYTVVHPGVNIKELRKEVDELTIPEEEYEKLKYYLKKFLNRYKKNPRIIAWMLFGEPDPIRKDFVSENEAELFAKFLKKNYKSIEDLNKKWGLEDKPFSPHPPLKDFRECYKLTQIRFWEDYRIRRDLMRFQTDISIENQKRIIEFVKKIDSLHPVRSGGHNLFFNAALYRWDWEKTAEICDMFVSSIHIPWHFEQVEGEEDIPLYIQAKMIVDFSTNAIPCAPETTGGSSRYSGYRPFTMTEEKIERFILYYLASGLKGFGFWLWNPRRNGYETGEYGITDLLGRVTKAGKRAGQIAKIINKYGKELWEVRQKVEVYIFYSWDNESYLARISEGNLNLKHLEHELSSSYARIGIARALINKNIPFKFLTDNQFLNDKVEPKKIIYLPWLESISEKILYKLYEYAKNGGRVIADIPVAYFDEYGKIFNTKKGSIFERLFGCSICNFYRIGRVEEKIKYKNFEIGLNEQWAEVLVTSGKILEKFENGYPCVIENKIGNGTVCLICFSISKICKKFGNFELEDELVRIIFNNRKFEPQCKEVLHFTLYGDSIDHHFLINNSLKNKRVKVKFENNYRKCLNLFENKEILIKDKSIEIFIKKGRGKWLRCLK